MKLLVFAHTPPPHHGQSYMVQLMLEGLGGDLRKLAKEKPAAGGDEIECYHVNCRVSDRIEDIGEFRFEKIWLLLRYCFAAIVCRFRYDVRCLYYVPAPGKRTALYRDWVVMLLCRPFFKVIIYHWHASGLGDWLHCEARRWERWVTHFLFDRHTLSLSLAVLGMRDALWFKARQVKIVPCGIPDPCPDYNISIPPLRKARAMARGKLLRNETLSATERDDANGDPEIFKVLYLAHCTREKGIFDALDAVAIANEGLNSANSRIRIQLTVAGAFLDESEEAEFRARIAKSDLLQVFGGKPFPSVKWASFVSGEAKWGLFRDSDCFCFPTYYRAETLPVSLIEAMAFGLPIVTTRWRAIPEMLPPDYSSFVNPNAPGEIAIALCSLFARYDGGNLRTRFLGVFSERQYIRALRVAFSEAPVAAA